MQQKDYDLERPFVDYEASWFEEKELKEFVKFVVEAQPCAG